MQRLSLTLLVMITLNGACGAPDDPSAASDDAATDVPRDDAGSPLASGSSPVRVGSYCERSSCTGCLERQRIANEGCFDCTEFCAVNHSEPCLAECQNICRRAHAITCVTECDAPVCYDESVSFSLVGEPDETIRAACIAANMHCSEPERLASLCDVAAKVESRAMLSTYRCLESKACTVEAQAPCIPASSGALCAWYCKALTEQGGACDGGDVETWLDASERWLRADVIESVEACESEVGAEDLTACVVRWLRVIGG